MTPRFFLLSLAVCLGLALLSAAGEDASANKIDQLIKQLGSESFAERQKATKALDAIGVPALEALRKAANGDDAEVKRRAGELLKKIEKRAESAKLLTPRRVHLVYKDLPLDKAVADLEKQSGYKIHLLDPKGELKKRKITLDTGAATFFHALELFCTKADLVEATMQDLIQFQPGAMPGGPPGALLKPRRNIKQPPPPPPLGQAPPPPGGALAVQAPPAPPPGKPAPAVPAAPRFLPAARPGMRTFSLEPGLIVLKDGKPKKLPSDDASAVRIRALPKDETPEAAPEGEFLLTLDVTPEPRLQWQSLESIRIEKALDERGQQLTPITPQVPAGPVPLAQARPPMMVPFGGGLKQHVAVYLKKGEKAAKSLKHLQGVISAHVLSEPKPMITVDNLAKAAGKTFKGKEGGSIKILDVKTDEDKKTTVQLEFERPPTDEVTPVLGGVPMPMQIRVGGAGAKPIRVANPVFNGPVNGLSIQDDKGNSLPMQIGPQRIRMVRRGGGIFTYTFVCQPGKDQGQPAKVVYLGRKRLAIDIPFRLKNVPLP